jgi:hypothetical protein
LLVLFNSNYTPEEVTLLKLQKGCFGQVCDEALQVCASDQIMRLKMG